MAFLNKTKIKEYIKNVFPFVKYRWQIYEFYKRHPCLSPRNIYYRRSEKIGQKDLTQMIPEPKNCKFVLEPLCDSNRDAVRAFADKYHFQDAHSNRIRHGYINTYRGVIAMMGEVVIGHMWYWAEDHGIRPPEELVFYNLDLGKNGVYLFDFYIAPEYRGSKNSIDFMTLSFLELKKQGYARTSGVHDPNNLAARWTYKVVGEKDAGPVNMYIFLNTVVYYDKAIYLKKRGQPDPCTSRKLFSFRKSFIK